MGLCLVVSLLIFFFLPRSIFKHHLIINIRLAKITSLKYCSKISKEISEFFRKKIGNINVANQEWHYIYRRIFKGQDVNGITGSNPGMILVLDIHKI